MTSKLPVAMVTASTENKLCSSPDPHISRAELLTRLNDNQLAIINVMPRETFREGHIPNSFNLPVTEIAHRGRSLLPNLAQEIAIYCASPN